MNAPAPTTVTTTATPAAPAPAENGRDYRPFIPEWMITARLTAPQMAVLVYLWCRAGQKKVCWPARETIAAECRLEIKTVSAVLNELEKRGLMTRRKHHRNSNEYVLHIGSVNPFGTPTPPVESTRLAPHQLTRLAPRPVDPNGTPSVDPFGTPPTVFSELSTVERTKKKGGKAEPPPSEFLIPDWPALTDEQRKYLHQDSMTLDKAKAIYGLWRARKYQFRKQDRFASTDAALLEAKTEIERKLRPAPVKLTKCMVDSWPDPREIDMKELKKDGSPRWVLRGTNEYNGLPQVSDESYY